MKVNILKISAFALALSLIAFSCEQVTTPEELLEESLGITNYNPDRITGSASSDNSQVDFSVKKDLNGLILIEVSVDRQQLIAELSFDEELVSFKKALLNTSQKLFTYIDGMEGDLAYTEYAIIRMMEYWSNAPEGYAYNGYTYTSPEGGKQLAGRPGNEGITCIRKGTYVSAEYDDSRGRRNERIRVGSKARSGYGCMGRCGADCGRWWIPSSWTKDCMDHDQCSNVNNSSGGGSDSNCGDEFNEAADDWAFGVLRVCRG